MHPLTLPIVLASSTLLAMVPPGGQAPADAKDAPKEPAKPAYAVKPLPGFEWDLWAQEPLVQDPVSFAIDDRGNLFLAESFRQEKGVEDNRSSKFWLEDDLQLQSVADRLRMYEKWASKRDGGMDYYRREEDRITKLWAPEDEDDRPGKATPFSGPLNDPLDGTGAGVLCVGGDVWYTCIPNLWRFRDTKGTGVADVREKVFEGFGVRVALRGHDMHGLAMGPDGRIYWSLGDRGYNVRTKEGKVLARPFTGAVFRCEPDGSRMEIFAHSLRNPQELAFNRWGDLFTGDNNSDAGDRARIVYVMEGGETGWDMNYQTLEGSNQRGPWSQEHTWWKWDAADKARPAWNLPPIEHLSDGPSGIVFYPGVGLPERYKDHFFLCDFLGGDEYSQVLSFAVEPDGAGYKVIDAHPFLQEVLPTDVDFGWDGRMYVSDWSNGWYSDRTGQVFRVWHPTEVEDVNIVTARNVVREGFAGQPDALLLQLLAHPDIRIRQRAHLELANRGPKALAAVASIAGDAGAQLTQRWHALYALGVAARRAADAGKPNAAAEAAVAGALGDADAQLRRLAARLCGDARIAAGGAKLVDLLTDEDMAVRAQACIALGKLKRVEAMPNIAAVAWENEDKDPFLRHAAMMGILGMDNADKVHELAADPFAQNRMIAVLAMRRMHDPQLARLLNDPDLRVATEAARAINDLPIDEATPALAGLAAKFAPDEKAIEQAAALAKAATPWKRQLWKDRKGFKAADLLTSDLWGTKADREEFGDEAIGYAKAGNDYVQRVMGTFTAPVAGDYVFAIASDDDSVLLVAPDGDAVHAKPVAKVDNYVDPGNWESQEGQKATVHLEAGAKAYVEGRAFQGGGGNHLAVGVVHPDGKVERPIGGYTGDMSAMPLLRRVVNANVRLGTPACAAALAEMARNPVLPPLARLEAIEGLAEFMSPAPRDRVNGHWRPVDGSKRDEAAYLGVLKQKLPSLAASGPAAVRTVARELASKRAVPMDSGAAFAAIGDATKPSAERVACLQQLAQDKDAKLAAAIDVAMRSDDARLRAAARTILARVDAARGMSALNEAMATGTVPERQAAVVAFGGLAGPQADAVLEGLVAKLLDGSLQPALAVDVMEAAATRPALAAKVGAYRDGLASKDKLAPWLLCLDGGDAERGRQVVNYNSAAQCLRCHMIEGTGGHAAPGLAGVAGRYDRKGLLASLIDPNAVVAQGFGPVSATPGHHAASSTPRSNPSTRPSPFRSARQPAHGPHTLSMAPRSAPSTMPSPVRSAPTGAHASGTPSRLTSDAPARISQRSLMPSASQSLPKRTKRIAPPSVAAPASKGAPTATTSRQPSSALPAIAIGARAQPPLRSKVHASPFEVRPGRVATTTRSRSTATAPPHRVRVAGAWGRSVAARFHWPPERWKTKAEPASAPVDWSYGAPTTTASPRTATAVPMLAGPVVAGARRTGVDHWPFAPRSKTYAAPTSVPSVPGSYGAPTTIVLPSVATERPNELEATRAGAPSTAVRAQPDAPRS